MLQTLQSWVEWIARLYTSYPDVMAMVTGDTAAGLLIAALDAWFYPTDWTIRKQQQASMIGVTIFGTLFSSLIWVGIDAADAKWFIGACSLMSAVIATPLYYIGSKALSAFFPKLQLSFALKH